MRRSGGDARSRPLEDVTSGSAEGTTFGCPMFAVLDLEVGGFKRVLEGQRGRGRDVVGCFSGVRGRQRGGRGMEGQLQWDERDCQADHASSRPDRKKKGGNSAIERILCGVYRLCRANGAVFHVMLQELSSTPFRSTRHKLRSVAPNGESVVSLDTQ